MSYNVTKNRLEKQQIYDIVRHTFGKDTEVRAMTLARQKGMEGVPIAYAFEENSFLSGSSYFIMECLEGDSYAAIKQKLTEEEQQTIDCEETNDQYVWVHGLFEKVWEEMEV